VRYASVGLADGRRDIAAGTQRGALSIALISGGGVSVGISESQVCRTAQDHPRRHAITVCVADLPVEEVYAWVSRTTDVFLAVEIHRSAGPVWARASGSHRHPAVW
jgi:hypothetical protein